MQGSSTAKQARKFHSARATGEAVLAGPLGDWKQAEPRRSRADGVSKRASVMLAVCTESFKGHISEAQLFLPDDTACNGAGSLSDSVWHDKSTAGQGAAVDLSCHTSPDSIADPCVVHDLLTVYILNCILYILRYVRQHCMHRPTHANGALLNNAASSP